MQETKSARILIADDEEIILELYAQIFKTTGNTAKKPSTLSALGEELFGDTVQEPDSRPKPCFELTLCRQAEEAVEAVRSAVDEKQSYVIAFLDVRMPPGRDGIWAAETIRSLCPEIQIVIVTGYSDVDPLEIERRVPPSDRLFYVQKPFHPYEIRQFTSTLTARWQAEMQMRRLNDQLERMVEKRTAQLEKAYAELKFRATHDTLTGIPNRASILDTLDKELDRSQRTGKPVAVVMADIDHFKSVNDAYGHQFGDAVLVETARRMRLSIRPYDTVGRFGGEEFLLVLPGCDLTQAVTVAERIISTVSREKIVVNGNKTLVTLSLGVTTAAGGKKRDVDALIARADQALYEAKSAGRNTARSLP